MPHIVPPRSQRPQVGGCQGWAWVCSEARDNESTEGSEPCSIGSNQGGQESGAVTKDGGSTLGTDGRQRWQGIHTNEGKRKRWEGVRDGGKGMGIEGGGGE